MRFFHDLYAKLSDPSANLQGNDLQILLVAMETWKLQLYKFFEICNVISPYVLL